MSPNTIPCPCCKAASGKPCLGGATCGRRLVIVTNEEAEWAYNRGDYRLGDSLVDKSRAIVEGRL